MGELILPSPHQIGSYVDVNFGNAKYLNGCKVVAVKFTENGMVLYDLKIAMAIDNQVNIIEGVGSDFVYSRLPYCSYD
ncbi:MAG TPA: hypothetical protein PK210_05065 [Bacteroidia bacterium]|nr:hypothetical protein [Bacteroidia bacterium]